MFLMFKDNKNPPYEERLQSKQIQELRNCSIYLSPSAEYFVKFLSDK